MPRPSLPDLASLDLFLTVVELGSVARAASAHGVAQPSASARLRQLERRLGVELLVRTPAGSVPTPAGGLVAEWATAVMQAADGLTAGVAALRNNAGRRISVAASHTLADHVVPAWLQAFRQRHDDTTVELQVANSQGVIERVRQGVADIGFIESPGGTSGLRSRVVGHDELVVVVPPSHAWARRRGPLPARMLSKTPLVLREEGSGTRDALVAALAEAGLEGPTTALQLGSSSAVKAAVAAGAGPAVLSRLAVTADIATGRLVEVVADLDLRRQFRAVWAPNPASAATVTALLGLSTL